jgi:large subunit ribosomal protein L9
MQIILLEKVNNLGNLGDVVRVKDGFARNFLIPKHKARRATATAVQEFEAKRAELEKIAAEKLALAQACADKLANITLTINQKAGADGRLFGSVTSHDITQALLKHDITLEKTQVRMSSPLKVAGEHTVTIALYADVVADVKVVVVGEEV